MRPLLTFIMLALLGSAVPAHAKDLEVVRVWPAYRTAESFDRIGSYFNRSETRGSETVRRSQPAVRDGYYFLVRLKNPHAAVAGATFELQVVTPVSPAPKTFTFQADVPAGTQAFNLGLTGSDVF